jgi:hypothetical protein
VALVTQYLIPFSFDEHPLDVGVPIYKAYCWVYYWIYVVYCCVVASTLLSF